MCVCNYIYKLPPPPPPGYPPILVRLAGRGAEHGHACSRTRPFYVGFSHTQPCVDPVIRAAVRSMAMPALAPRTFYVGYSHTQPCVDPVTGRGAEHGHACCRTRPFYVGYSPRSSDR